MLQSGIDRIGCVIFPRDEANYTHTLGEYARHITFIPQQEPKGYGHAIYMAKNFIENEPFLHLVGDHLYVSRNELSCAAHLVEMAEKEKCAISAVSATRESVMPNYGVIGGMRVKGSKYLYKIEHVIEKPTPTEAEQKLLVPGLRAGHYLCFFGMHVLTPAIFAIFESKLQTLKPEQKIDLSQALNELAGQEKYLALEKQDWRYDMGAKYGLLKAQVALAMSGKDRDHVLAELLELFTSRELGQIGR